MTLAYIIGLTVLFLAGMFLTYVIGLDHGTLKERRSWQNFINLLRKANGV